MSILGAAARRMRRASAVRTYPPFARTRFELGFEFLFVSGCFHKSFVRRKAKLGWLVRHAAIRAVFLSERQKRIATSALVNGIRATRFVCRHPVNDKSLALRAINVQITAGFN